MPIDPFSTPAGPLFLPPPRDVDVALDNGKYMERERIKRVIRSIITEVTDPNQDYPAGRCCVNRLVDVLEAVSDAAREEAP